MRFDVSALSLSLAVAVSHWLAYSVPTYVHIQLFYIRTYVFMLTVRSERISVLFKIIYQINVIAKDWSAC